MTPDHSVATVLSLPSVEPAATAFPVIAAKGATAEYPITIEACLRPLPAAEIGGKIVICDRVVVPENHGTPEGPRISLSFALLEARAENPAPDPLNYLNGGAGRRHNAFLAGGTFPVRIDAERYPNARSRVSSG